MRHKKLIVFVLSILMSSLFTGCYFLPKEEEVLAPPVKEPEKVTYDTIKVKKATIENKIRCTGYYISIIKHDLFFKDKGVRLKDIYVKTGEKVKKGDLIAEVETDTLLNDIKLQEIALKKSQIIYNKIKTQFDIEGGGDRSELDLAALDVEADKLRLDSLLSELEKSRLTSPIDGDIVYVSAIKPGELINAYQTIVTIADPSQLQIKYSGDRVSDFKLGMQVDIYELEKVLCTGKVIMTPADLPVDADEESKKSIFIALESLPKGVGMGSSATFSLILEKRDNVIVLPNQVINSFDSRKFVNVLKNGIREERDVELGIQTDTEVEVVKGLDAGEYVIR